MAGPVPAIRMSGWLRQGYCSSAAVLWVSAAGVA